MWHSATYVEANISTVSHVSSVQVQDCWIFLDTFWYIWFNIKLRILAFSEGRVSLTLQAASNQPGVSFQEARIIFNAGQKQKVESSRKNINQYIGPMAFYLDFSRFWFVVILFMWPCLLGCEVPEVRIRQETENVLVLYNYYVLYIYYWRFTDGCSDWVICQSSQGLNVNSHPLTAFSSKKSHRLTGTSNTL